MENKSKLYVQVLTIILNVLCDTYLMYHKYMTCQMPSWRNKDSNFKQIITFLSSHL